MTIRDCIARLDALRQNAYTFEEKLRWLSVLEGRIGMQLFDLYEPHAAAFPGYDSETDPDTELLAPHPYDEVYLRWLEAQIDYHNGEYGRYNNAILLFNAAWDELDRHLRRSCAPRPIGPFRF